MDKKNTRISKKSYRDMAAYKSYAEITHHKSKKKQKKGMQTKISSNNQKNTYLSHIDARKEYRDYMQRIVNSQRPTKKKKRKRRGIKKVYSDLSWTENPPKIFYISAHSSICTFKDMDKIMYNGTHFPIKKLDEASKKYTKHRKQYIKELEILSKHKEIDCHQCLAKNKKTQGRYFCFDCLQETSNKNICKYILCKDCNNKIHKESSRHLHRPVLIYDRIDLDKLAPKNSDIKVLIGQSAGRSGIVNTGFYLMREYVGKDGFKYLRTNVKKQLHEISDTSFENIKKQDAQMKKLDDMLNLSNKKHNLHRDGKDTNFRIYPRISGKRFIPGPKNVNLNFSINLDLKKNLNGVHWPLGIYNLDDITPEKWLKLFNNREHESEFFNTITKQENRDNSINKKNEEVSIKKSLLLYLDRPTLYNQKRIPNCKESYETIKEYLNVKHSNSKSSSTNDTHINRYNHYIYSKLFSKVEKKHASLEDIIKIICDYEKSISMKTHHKFLFIINMCRVISDHYEGNLWDQTENPKLKHAINQMRKNSNNL